MPTEIVINDANAHLFIDPHVDGERKKCGTILRDWTKHAYGSLMHAKPFDLPLIPESEQQGRLDELIKNKAQLSDVRNQGMNGKQIPSRDQNGKGFCVTEDTEILTLKGWVPYPEYDWSDLVATMNPVTGHMEFQAPTHRHVYEYDGDMMYSTNRRLDFGVTPDHRMLVRKWDERAKTLSNQFTFQRAGELGWYVGLPHSTKGFRGTNLVRLGIEGDRVYAGDDLLALIALIVSDGWAGGSESTRNWVSFCYYREDRYQMVADLAARVGFKEKTGVKGVWYRYDAVALASWVRVNCYDGSGHRASNKKIPDLVKCATMRQIGHFLRFFGDQNHGVDSQEVFYSTSKPVVDTLQELLMRVGRRSTIRHKEARISVYEQTGQTIQGGPSYVLTVSETDRLCIDRKKHIETEKYKGLVYCATVPNGTLITRRNGSVLISGNCWAHSSTSAMMIARAVAGEPYADLSAYMVACIIKGYRDEGGWGSESLEYIAENGIPDSKFWPQQSMSRSNDTPEMRADAKKHRFTNWRDLDPNNMKQQLITCLLMGFPVVSDFNWWSHSVCTIDLVSINPFKTRIWNSWGDSWSESGTGVLEGRKAIPDSALCAITMTPSPA